MSKMPAKKKSCFQITSVTQAQVAASSVADDTESLDDPDESRTEDVSSEIFDVSRSGGGGADLLGACDRSSSEETLNNNVGEQQHQEGGHHQHHHQGPVNGGFSVRGSAGCSGPVTPHLAVGGVPAGPTASQAPSAPSSTTTTQPMVNSVPHHHHVTLPANVAPVIPVAAAATITTITTSSSSSSSTTTTTTTYNSRFRVIKLDHGTGEPFRRGRWTCTEFYERDSEGSTIMSRTVDSIKHAVVLDHNNVDRGDSGLGGVTTGGSVVIPSAGSAQESNNNADSGYSVAYHTHPPEQPPQQGYTLASQAGSAGACAFQPTGGYSTAVPQQQHPQQANNMQPGVPQNLLHPSGLNGAPLHGAANTLQQFPLMPPHAAQQFAYSTHGGGQLDYRQQQFAPLQPHGSNAQNLSVGPPAGLGGPSPAISPAGVVAQVGEALMFQVGGGGASSVGSVLLATTTTTVAYNSVHNVPATVPNSMLMNHTPGAGGGGFESGRKSDILPQLGASALAAKDGGLPFISQSVGGKAPTTVSIFGIPITIDGDEDSTSGASVVAIDNKIEQAMDLVKSHLMYAVREEVEVLKEQIKELFERNSMLERENAVLKSLANTEQLSLVVSAASQAVSTSLSSGSMSPPQQQQQMIVQHYPSTASLGGGAATNNNNNLPNASLAQHEGGQQTAPAHHQPGSA